LCVATIPVADAFGFAPELLKKTSGNATAPQLSFCRWQQVDENPFWRPTTLDEREEFGDLVAEHNSARVVVDRVRKRKGLAVEEKVVAGAEKQRNLSKKK
jgi:ribosome assembly protein 1